MKVYTLLPKNGGSRKVYHTDTDCPRLRDRYSEHELSVLGDHMRECKYCAGEVNETTKSGTELSTKLERMEAESPYQ